MTPPSNHPLIPESWGEGLPEVFYARLGDQIGRQRHMSADGHSLLVLHQPPEPDDELRAGRLFWRDAEGAWRSSHHGDGAQALTQHLEEYSQRIERVDLLEERSSGVEAYFGVTERIAPLRRAVTHLHHVLQEAREAHAQDRELILLRDQAYALERRAELLAKNTESALNFEIARQAERQAQSSYQMALSAHRLNVLAAFFFPITAISSLLGVNYKEVIAGTFPPSLFMGAVAIGLCIGLVIMRLISPRNR